MKKGLIAGVIAVVALAAIIGVVVTNNRNNKTPSVTSSTNTEGQSDDTSNSGASTDQATPPPSPNPSNAAATKEVAIEDFAFTPATITVKKGTTVTWTNKDSVSHTVTGDSDGGPDSELFGNGESYSFTFNAVGTFAYHCAPHPQMTGTVIVTE